MNETIEDLRVFKKSHELTLDLYKLTAHFPNEEKFGLTSQIRRASSSICANLMEGIHRNSRNEYKRYANISRGSTGELKYHLMLAKDLKYISEDHYRSHFATVNDVSKMLSGLIASLSKPLITNHESRITNHESRITHNG